MPKYKNHFFITEFCFATKREAQEVHGFLGDIKNKANVKTKKAYTFIYTNKVLLVTINREMARGVVEFFEEEMQMQALEVR